ncbi:MFS transporter [Synoicihabitans lomoniglobus]|uniref:MFS transporter n=1 Tax=Synoicihabitans lomoniglobus TaxID=2909285 RepID=A0AAE9ZYA7_9BACT|nr:MFS transporter [Opitutaceae bacterium LMO-M01]WED64808.1 MFS transporter [Opitutaceae bacterium LMO-M01]
MSATVTPVSRLQTHFFAVFAVFGCVTPFIPIYLRDVKGLNPAEIGYIFATAQSGVLIMPIVMTFIADRYRIVRALLLTLFAFNIIGMGMLATTVGFWACLIWVALNRLATQPQVALGDGLYFTLQNDPAQPRATFSQVRVWGTIGFIVPSAIMFTIYELGGGVQWMPAVTAAMAIIGVINSTGMPRRTAATKTPPKVPTLEAARVLLRPTVALFVVGCGFVVFTNMAFYSFYPLYLTQEVGISERWIGVISSFGVGLEILYMLSLERMRARIGLGGILLVGGLASLFRLACLGWLPTPFFAVFFQVFHGMTVLGFMVVPVMYLNEVAAEGFRNSIQGLYVMIVAGLFSIAGNIAAGQLAEIGLLTLYRVAFIVCAFGLALIAASFRLRRRQATA